MKNQEQTKYQIDARITKGLTITLEPKKIKNNCKLIGIDIPYHETKISNRNNISILTIGCGHNSHVQYIIKDCFDINYLNTTSNEYIPYEFKELIINAHSLTKPIIIKELLN
jgi:hypothetical protein